MFCIKLELHETEMFLEILLLSCCFSVAVQRGMVIEKGTSVSHQKSTPEAAVTGESS